MFNSLFDAYTVRKIAPRLIVAVIGVNLSIYLCVAVVDITNIIGGGIADLMRQPFRQSGAFESIGLPANAINTVVGAGGIVGVVGLGLGATVASGGVLGVISGAAFAAAGFAAASIGMFLLVAMVSVALIVLAIAATIVIRYGAILVLTLVSPIAIALLVLPGTEKYFKAWWDIFMKTLIMYPIIAVIFAMSDILSALLLVTLGRQNQGIAFVAIFVIIIALYAPLFMIPFAYKMAGGIIGGIYDFANKNGVARVNEKLSKWKQDPHSAYGKKKTALKIQREARGGDIKGIGRGLQSIRRARGSVGSRGDHSRRSHFLEAYKSGYETVGGEEFANERAEEFKKRFGHLEGYDDMMKVLQTGYGKNHGEIMQLLADEDPTKFSMSGARREATMQAADQIMQMQGELGTEQMARRVGVSSQMQAVTAFKDVGEMLEFVDKAADGDSSLRSMLLAKAQKTQDQLGRHDIGGAGFTNTSATMEAYVNRRKQYESEGKSGAELDTLMRTYATQLEDNGDESLGLRAYKDMVEEKKSDVAQGQGHERSLNSMMQHKMKRFKEAVENAQTNYDTKKIELQQQGLSGKELDIALEPFDVSRDAKVQEYTAKLENMGEASAYFSGANRELVGKVLRGEEVTELAGAKFKVAKQETSIPGLKINTKVKVKRPVAVGGEIQYEEVPDPARGGEVVRRPKMEEVYETRENINIRQLADEKMRGDKDHAVYNTNKREFGRVQAEQEAAERLANTGLGPNIPGVG